MNLMLFRILGLYGAQLPTYLRDKSQIQGRRRIHGRLAPFLLFVTDVWIRIETGLLC